MIKQSMDARHLKEKGGGYVGLSGRDAPAALGGEIGRFYYPSPHVEGRLGLAGLIYEGDEPVSGGLLAGARLQSPTRLAPFVGIGAYAGFTPEIGRSEDGIDNDFDGFVDNSGEAESTFVGALIPEAGCHFWLTPGWRVTGSASYYVTTSGPEDNFLMLNVSLARLSDLGSVTSSHTLTSRARELGWQVGDGPSSDDPLADFQPTPNLAIEKVNLSYPSTKYPRIIPVPAENLADNDTNERINYSAMPATSEID
ncbi:MAG: hypothetical protein GXP24_13530 [Planctomycetes bacterium]|nr:hypothetical protein [Planctomycetota bacterium]